MNYINKKIFIFLVIFLVFPSAIFAQDDLNVEISMKDTFSPGEDINFEYIVTGGEGDVVVFPEILCEGEIPVKFPEEIVIKNNQKNKEYKYSGVEVAEDFATQECNAVVNIISPINKKYEKKFSILTKPIINAELSLCVDEKCSKNKTSFKKNEKVYINARAQSSVPLYVKVSNGDHEELLENPSWYFFKNEGKYIFEIISLSDSFIVKSDVVTLEVNPNNTVSDDKLFIDKDSSKMIIIFSVVVLLSLIILFFSYRFLVKKRN